MKKQSRKTITILILSLLVTVSLPLMGNAEKIKIQNYEVETCGIDQEINLIRGEFYLYLDAVENVTSFNLKYSFPAEYNYQYPIYLEISQDTTANIKDYKIEDENNAPNKIINFTIGDIKTDKQVLIHFNCWVLTLSYNYEGLPDFINITPVADLPNATKIWLNSTEVVQSDNILIKLRAKQQTLFTEKNLLKIAKKTAKFCKLHKYLLFLMHYKLQKILQYPPQDALTTLLKNGECPGRSHLGCALFRANNIPARVILAMPTKYDFWYEMHYMTEYYCKDYNWILTEIHGGETPYPQQNQIILRICYPEDENNTQADFIYPRMKCLERWMWIDNENVTPYYKDCKEGSKIKSFNENTMTIDLNIVNDTVKRTQNVFSNFTKYLKMDLKGENLQHFKKAGDYISLAIKELDSSNDAFGYIYYMDYALDEFNYIND